MGTSVNANLGLFDPMVVDLVAVSVQGLQVASGAPEADFRERLVLCGQHGPALYCHVNADGRHVDASSCMCKRHPELCPIDVHRDRARIAKPQLFLVAETDSREEEGEIHQSYPRLAEPEIKDDGTAEYSVAESWGGSPEQLQKAALMFQLGLKSKAKRQAYCGLCGKRYSCETGACPDVYKSFGCGNRYCPPCASRIFNRLFNEYMKLEPVARSLVPHWPIRPGDGIAMHYVLAKLDIMPINVGVMPTPEQSREFNRNIRKFMRAVAERYIFPIVKQLPECLAITGDSDLTEKQKRNRIDRFLRSRYGLLWVDEFGSGPVSPVVRTLRRGTAGNTNLHAHACYAGPWLPNKQKELSELWLEIVGTPALVSIKPARSFQGALAHALKYAGKFLSRDPARLAELEVAFHGVRRVHCLGAFYNVKGDGEGLSTGSCPYCGAHLLDSGEPWIPVRELQQHGIKDVEEVRREIGRKRILAQSRGSPI